MPRKTKFINLLVVAVMILTACSTGANQPPEAEKPAPQQEVVENTPAQEVEEPMAEAPTAEEAVVEEAAQPTTAEEGTGQWELGFSEGDPNLHASDPTSVNLAAGKPQFVEFFAFW
jgi:hypothetical protein